MRPQLACECAVIEPENDHRIHEHAERVDNRSKDNECERLIKANGKYRDPKENLQPQNDVVHARNVSRGIFSQEENVLGHNPACVINKGELRVTEQYTGS